MIFSTLILSTVISLSADCSTYVHLQDMLLLGVGDFAIEDELTSLRADYPSCDSLYLSSMRFFPHDEEVYASYFQNAARDPVILALLLERYDELSPFFPPHYRDPFNLLERLIWVNNLPEGLPCPCRSFDRRIKFSGYIDDLRPGCYRFILLFKILPAGENRSIVFSFSEEIFFAQTFNALKEIMAKASVPRLQFIIYTDRMPETGVPSRPPRPPS